MRNKFLYFVIFWIVLIIGVAVYIAIFKKWIDRNSYVELIEWTATLNNEELKINDRKKLKEQDIITTTSKNALAVIEWWDWSITRLWWNTSVKVNELYVSKNVNKLNISFELFNWKTWSNVISLIPDDSYFIQSFVDMEAAVRWTIFNVDLENEYLYVVENSVELTKNDWNTKNIEANKPFNLRTFSFMNLIEFVNHIQDKAFEELNRQLDIELLKFMIQKAYSDLTSLTEYASIQIENLSKIDQQELYAKILAKYQEINFVNINDNINLYELKISLKEKLYELAPDKEKQVYMNSLLWELNNIIKNWNNNDLAKFVLNEFIEDKDKLTKEITNKIEETLETISNTNFYNELKNSWDNWILFNIKTSWEDVKNNSWFNSLIQSFINESNKLKSIFNFKI